MNINRFKKIFLPNSWPRLQSFLDSFALTALRMIPVRLLIIILNILLIIFNPLLNVDFLSSHTKYMLSTLISHSMSNSVSKMQ